jgi:hypothetical protein
MSQPEATSPRYSPNTGRATDEPEAGPEAEPRLKPTELELSSRRLPVGEVMPRSYVRRGARGQTQAEYMRDFRLRRLTDDKLTELIAHNRRRLRDLEAEAARRSSSSERTSDQ